MPGGGGSAGTQTVTQKSEPWAEQRPYLVKGFEKADQWLQGNQPNYYPNSTVVPMNAEQAGAISGITERADSGSAVLRAGQNAVERMANNGNQNLQQTINGGFLGLGPVNQSLGGYASGDFSGTGHGQTLSTASSGNFGNLAGGGALTADAAGANLNANPVNQYLGSTAAGGYLGGNPYMDAMVSRAAQPLVRNFSEAVMPAIDAQFARAGRFGSGAQANVADSAIQNLGRSLTDLSSQMYGQAYDAERNRMQQAAGTIGNAYAQERGLQQNAATGLMGSQLGAAQNLMGTQLNSAAQVQAAYEAERNRMQQAAMADSAAQLQAAGMSPQMAMADYADLSQKLNAGNILQGQDQALLADDMARWNFQQNKDINKLGQYMGLIGGGYGSTQTTQQPIYNNRLAGALGGALGGAQLGGMFGGPWGAAIGAGAGGLMSMFG